MNPPTVQVDGVSKRYRLGGLDRKYRTLRDSITAPFRKGRRQEPSEVWALRDISLDIREGEALGLIGRNGAGKSTLLKILSRITEPTEGEVRMRGRVASLLEVGTGFHPELTGRDNIYLNGAILGMRREEIRRNFDAIVQFAEVERFLDTPVKHYSSGMYVRLAFGVAAHLTPEILLVDEVLAVGDFEFQRRCLGRMHEVASSGRTVVFVSHNLGSIEELCSRTVLLNGGRIERDGASDEVIAHYLSANRGESLWDVRDVANREGSGRARITRMELRSAEGQPIDSVSLGQPFRIRIEYEAHERMENPTIGLALLTERDERVFLTSSSETQSRLPALEGRGWVECHVQSQNLLPKPYFLETWIYDPRDQHTGFADHLRMVGKVEIVIGAPQAHRIADLTYHDRGHVYMSCDWSSPQAR